MLVVFNDTLAEKLESAGLWRRAKTRWLVVMQSPVLAERQRLWISRRREFCQSQIMHLEMPEKLDMAEIDRAATATMIRMGIVKPNRALFRAYPRQKIKA